MALPKPLRVGSAAAVALLLAACDDDPTGPVLCVSIFDYTIGETVSGNLVSGDCQLTDGSFVDFYEVSVPTQQMVRFEFSSGSFDPFLFLLKGPGFDAPLAAFRADTLIGSSTIHLLMAPDTYVVGANALSGGQTGSYALSSVSVTDQAVNCAEIWVTRGVATVQSIDTTDCAESSPGGTFYSDEYFVVLGTGASITITMQSTAVDSYLLLINSDNEIVAENDDFGVGFDARVVYNAPQDDRFVIVATTFDPDTTGAYGLTIQ